MEDENRFDELLKSKLSERDFPFDEMNWDEAEKQIIKQENRRKMTRFGLIFASGLMAGIIIMLPFMLKNSSFQIVSAGDNKSLTEGSQNSALAKSKSGNKRETTSFSTNKKGPGLKGSENLTENTAPQIAKNALEPLKEKKYIASGGHQPINEPGLGQANNAPLGAVNSLNTSVQSHGKGIELASNNEAGNKNQHLPSAGNHHVVKNSLSTSAHSSFNNNSPESSNETNTQNQVTSENLQPLQPITVNIEETPFDPKISSACLSGYWYFSEVDSVNPNPTSVVPKDSNRPEFAMLRVNWSGHVGSEYKPLNSIFIDAGANYSLGWNNGESKEGKGITPILGISWHHYFNDKIFSSLGIQPQILAGLNKTYSADVTGYDFGSNENITKITPKTLYYIGLPLKVGLNLNNKNIFTFGLNLLYLLNSSSTETTYNQNYFETTNYNTTVKSGYTEGFNATDIQVSLGYTLMLTSQLGFSAEYYFGLQPVENSEFFMSNQIDKNSGIRAVVLYRIFK